MKKTKSNIIEKIALDMMSTQEFTLDKKDVISDEVIISNIMALTDLEETDRDGRTLLLNAAFYNRQKVIEYLLSRGADIHTKDKMGNTVLHATVQNGYLDCIKLLLSAGAEANAKDIYGNTPLGRARLNTPKEIFNIFIENGVDPYEKNNFGVSLIDVYQAYPDILKILTGSANT